MRNGAGKTTLVRILATLLKPDRGRARVAGFDVAENPAAVRRRIGLSGQYAAVDPFLTGQENLVMIGRLSGLSRRAARRRAGELTGQLRLSDAAGRLVRTYSGGMRRRLDLAASLLAAPRSWSSMSRPPVWTPAAAWSCGRSSDSSPLRAAACS
jgi:ABC-2 type transport system ATP-binding protein